MKILILILIIALIVLAIVIYKKPKGMSFSQFSTFASNKPRKPLFDFSGMTRDRKLSIFQSFLFIFGVFFLLMVFITPDETICFGKSQIIAKRSYTQDVCMGSDDNGKSRYENRHFYDIIVNANGEKLDLTYEKSRFDYNSGKLCIERKTKDFKTYLVITIMIGASILALAFLDR